MHRLYQPLSLCVCVPLLLFSLSSSFRSVDQALNVADEISFSFPSSSSSAVSSYFSSSSFYDPSSSHTQRDVCDPLLISGGGGSAGVEPEDEDDDRYYSTVVDDIFFILNKSVSRAIDSLDVLAVCAIINNICNLLSSDVKNKLRKNLEESKGYYSNYIKVSRLSYVRSRLSFFSSFFCSSLVAATDLHERSNGEWISIQGCPGRHARSWYRLLST